MTALRSITYATAPADAEVSHITGLQIMRPGGVAMLFATTRMDGHIQSWDINSGQLTVLAQTPYAGGAQLGVSPQVTTFDDHLLSLGQGLTFSDPNAQGQLSAVASLDLQLGLQALSGQISVTGDVIYAALQGQGGIAALQVVTGDIVQSRATFGQGETIAAMTSVDVDGTGFVIGATQDASLHVWAGVQAAQAGSEVTYLTADDGLWVSAPTVIETAVVNGHTLVFLGAAGSNSITVLHLKPDGTVQITDHLIDTRDTRFAGITALEIAEHDGQTYVIAGGADDGVSVFMVMPNGQLLARAHLADTVATGLANVSAIAAASIDEELAIFVASSSEVGVTRLSFLGSGVGETRYARISGGNLQGTGLADLLIGGVGDDRIIGYEGDDVLIDGSGEDLLIGSAGYDTFAMSADGQADQITHFEFSDDRIDLTNWIGLRSTSQLHITVTDRGFTLGYGQEFLDVAVKGARGDAAAVAQIITLGGMRIDQAITAALPGPATPDPELPERPEIVPPDPPDPQPQLGLKLNGSGNVDQLVGDVLGDQINGRAGNDLLYGRGGDDVINGGSGADYLAGEDGADTLFGGAGRNTGWLQVGTADAAADVIYGGAGDDLMLGQSGADRLYGQAGDDILTGGGGRDRFYFDAGQDRITDFNSFVDEIVLDNALWAGTLSAQQVVTRHASLQGGATVFAFGQDTLTLEGFSDLASLAHAIDFY